MIKIVLVFICFFCSTATISAQVKTPNAVYVEVIGNGGFYSVNYERLFCNYFGFRVGASYLYLGDVGQYASFPILANFFMGGKHHKFELGVGCTVMNDAPVGEFSNWDTKYFRTITLGYRYQSKENFFRIGFTPLFTGHEIIPLGGISFGRAF
ncbi:MAG TPA: hypothetical protein PLH27_02995 [bacterium]|nr:hypothetical protein [bacterium]HND75423.1 hypothetical protein [Saprospiraceae bacterium]HMY36005.1 hypothetical protein [bacterium]HMZ05528.1 hypothetical protein [bacterium]HNB09919.1 hypothetical protein [bacterium]